MSPRTYECVVCKKKSQGAKGLKIFPDDPEYFKKWCAALDPTGTKKFLATSRVCHSHFQKEDFYDSGVLKPRVIPSILHLVSAALYWGMFFFMFRVLDILKVTLK